MLSAWGEDHAKGRLEDSSSHWFYNAGEAGNYVKRHSLDV
jgi:hypothetical protein